ncbi:STAS/SEC14 domain-containing protein [Bosea minatitlanensis]|uniref:STAS/SEC14 domain-containing protein n=1 Tax=Bosea minatitlanensis TaxID=128782 RepID=A0ABW0F972_9HYPH|nr:STAS/SEC14 domain-containing protein [Bosea minatitlanensis]MCT4495056.1 STAS/SEC14 domain-containing protein [Bosea minatitlanensis]
MITFLPAPDHVLAIALSGTIEPADIERVAADLEERLARHEKVSILADLTDFDDMTFAAAWKDARYGFGKLWELRRFPKEAIIVEKGWLDSAARLFAPVIPFVAIRSFPPSEREAALAWAADIEGGPDA